MINDIYIYIYWRRERERDRDKEREYVCVLHYFYCLLSKLNHLRQGPWRRCTQLMFLLVVLPEQKMSYCQEQLEICYSYFSPRWQHQLYCQTINTMYKKLDDSWTLWVLIVTVVHHDIDKINQTNKLMFEKVAIKFTNEKHLLEKDIFNLRGFLQLGIIICKDRKVVHRFLFII